MADDSRARAVLAALRAESNDQASLHRVVEMVVYELHDRHATKDILVCQRPLCREWRHLLREMVP